MRPVIAFIAAAALLYCSYVVLNTDTNGAPILTFLQQTQNIEPLRYHIGGIALSFTILIWLAFKRTTTRTVTEGRRLDEVQAFLDGNLPWIKELANTSHRAALMANNLRTLESDVDNIRDARVGLVANIGTVDAILPGLKQRLEALSRDQEGQDLLVRADDIIGDYERVVQRLGGLQKLSERLPGMAAELSRIKAAVDKFEDGETGILATVEKLLEGLDELLDSNGEGRIAAIEAGNDNFDGDLDDEVQAVRNAFRDVREGLERLKTTRDEIDEVMADVAKLAPPKEPLKVAAE